MAVTKQTYTATATWTASQLADTFKTAFVDAGLMTDWHDSFLNTVENRVLKVVYDASKTYGTVYYWFMFTTGGVFIHTALDWTPGSDVPAGSQYFDYFATTTNSTSNHRTLTSLVSATTTTLTRYTSGVNTACSWFVVRNGTTNVTFMIPSAGFGPQAFVDQSKVAFNHLIYTLAGSSGYYSHLSFVHGGCHTRRTFLGAEALRSNTTTATFQSVLHVHKYLASGNSSNQSSNFSTSNSDSGVWLPTASANTQTALASEHTPVFTGPTVSPYLSALPSDFGMAAYYASNSMAIQDTLVVSSGSEEWEMLSVSTNSASDAGRLMFLARVV